MAFINRATALNVKSELDIFTTLPIQTTIESGSLQTYRPITSISNNGPIEFFVSGSSNDEYIDLARVYILVKAKITLPPPVNNAPVPIAGPVNNWLHSMFSQVDVYLNQKCITPPNNCYNYKAYVENLLNYGLESKKTHLSTQIWAEDSASHMNSVGGNNAGFTTRQAFTANNKTVDLFGPLHCDLFNVDKYLINGVEMTIKMQKAKDDFHIMGAANTAGDFSILDAVLYVRKVKISPSTLLAHQKALSVATAKYPINRVEVKSITIPADTRSRVFDNIFLGD